ncbi:site-specific integrase [Virgibacillus halodenitrificans]|uniref:site-specific integrase n=1 Tax=Virgibacillus halodenitrificans TaxID=1482 RepID=UPI001F3609DF|nr:site-specific integrase [Virgibacillus halodenitrificans]
MGDIKLFKLDGDNVDELEGQSVAVEKLLQHITERHLETFLGVRFLPSEYITGKRYYLVFLILSYSGIRVGELIALKWKDIDFVNHTISITKTCYNPSNIALKYQLGTPKTRKSRRKIIVDGDVIEALNDHKKVQDDVIERLGDDYYNKILFLPKCNDNTAIQS